MNGKMSVLTIIAVFFLIFAIQEGETRKLKRSKEGELFFEDNGGEEIEKDAEDAIKDNEDSSSSSESSSEEDGTEDKGGNDDTPSQDEPEDDGGNDDATTQDDGESIEEVEK